MVVVLVVAGAVVVVLIVAGAAVVLLVGAGALVVAGGGAVVVVVTGATKGIGAIEVAGALVAEGVRLGVGDADAETDGGRLSKVVGCAALGDIIDPSQVTPTSATGPATYQRFHIGLALIIPPNRL